ncbi:hypothetical protein GCM10023115_28160 [Pontixanthobacter gangjinensis]|uniref:EcsC family protein n=1 Tax=Christiangramia aestuarii TaxID=1028746 RepID=A0A7K1LMT8_9FLAO|nr:hypothetical protein [Christiangramia aestuarii]MUP42048.1 hypothetical protein [Christiangramia aestuarii]
MPILKTKKLEITKDFDFMKVVNFVSPSFESVQKDVTELKKGKPNKTNKQLSRIYANRIRNKYTSVGVVSALPSTIPGVGTGVQIAIEAGTISGDLILMLRWMASTCYGIALINGKDISSDFNQEFVRILGLWCGAIEASKKATGKIATKVAVTTFNKKVSGKTLAKINQRVGTTIFTKYGTKRGGIALGKLIPMGVGVAVGGTFNYVTMTRFKNSAIKYFESDESVEYVIKN